MLTVEQRAEAEAEGDNRERVLVTQAGKLSLGDAFPLLVLMAAKRDRS